MSTSIQDIVARMLRPLSRRIRLMVGRAVITALDDSGGMQVAQVRLLSGEVRDGVEILMQYGHSSLAPGKPEGVYFALGGDRDHGMLINVGTRSVRFKGLRPGESVLHDDQGQKVHLTREGIVIETPLPITLRTPQKVRVEAPLLECTGEIKDRCDTDGRTLESMRTAYDGHTHRENDAGGETNTPTQRML